VPRDDLVDRIDERRRVERPERSSKRPGQADLREERHASSGVAGDEGAVAGDEPPALVLRRLGYVCEQAPSLFIGQWKQRECFVPVEPGDDTRRPPAELSRPGIEQGRARQVRG
jgi:hypothetical protein